LKAGGRKNIPSRFDTWKGHPKLKWGAAGKEKEKEEGGRDKKKSKEEVSQPPLAPAYDYFLSFPISVGASRCIPISALISSSHSPLFLGIG